MDKGGLAGFPRANSYRPFDVGGRRGIRRYNWRPSTIGFLIGLGVALPLIGRVAGVPSSVLGLFATALSIGLAALSWREYKIRPLPLALIAMALVYATLVIFSANYDQIRFLLRPGQWLEHLNRYADSKLLMFLVTFSPALAMASVVAIMGNHHRVFRGILVAVLCVATLAAARIWTSADSLIGDTYLDVRPYYADIAARGYSLVSYGVLLALGSAAAIALRRTWVLAAVFMFLAFWLNRRTETLSIAVLVAAYYGLMAWRRPSWRAARVWCRAPIIFGVAAILAGSLYNPSNVGSWGALLGASTENRIAILQDAVTFQDGASPSLPTDTRQTPVRPAVSDSSAVQKSAESGGLLFGEGLASYARRGGPFLWPHNLLVETFIEGGILAALILASVIATAFAAAAANIFLGREVAPEWLAIAAMGCVIFVVSMKSGDVTSAGRLTFFLVAMSAGVGPVVFGCRSDAVADR